MNYTVVMTSQAGLSLGGELLSSLGCSEPDVVFLKRGIKAAQAQRCGQRAGGKHWSTVATVAALFKILLCGQKRCATHA